MAAASSAIVDSSFSNKAFEMRMPSTNDTVPSSTMNRSRPSTPLQAGSQSPKLFRFDSPESKRSSAKYSPNAAYSPLTQSSIPGFPLPGPVDVRTSLPNRRSSEVCMSRVGSKASLKPSRNRRRTFSLTRLFNACLLRNNEDDNTSKNAGSSVDFSHLNQRRSSLDYHRRKPSLDEGSIGGLLRKNSLEGLSKDSIDSITSRRARRHSQSHSKGEPDDRSGFLDRAFENAIAISFSEDSEADEDE